MNNYGNAELYLGGNGIEPTIFDYMTEYGAPLHKSGEMAYSAPSVSPVMAQQEYRDEQPPHLTPIFMSNTIRSLDARVKQLENILAQQLVHMSALPGPQGRRANKQELVRNRDLLPHCSDFFAAHFNPSTTEFNKFSRSLEAHFPVFERKTIASSVRRWFRKRRDELGQKVFLAAEEQLYAKFTAGANLKTITAEVKSRGELFQNLMSSSELLSVFRDPNVAASFLMKKISSFYDRRILGKAPCPNRKGGNDDDDLDDDMGSEE